MLRRFGFAAVVVGLDGVGCCVVVVVVLLLIFIVAAPARLWVSLLCDFVGFFVFGLLLTIVGLYLALLWVCWLRCFVFCLVGYGGVLCLGVLGCWVFYDC